MFKNYSKVALVGLISVILTACGGGGSTRPDNPEPSQTCSQKLGVSPYVTSTSNGPTVTDSVCPSGQTLVTAGQTYQRTTTTYSCPNPSSTSNPVASSSQETVVVTSKVCSTTPVTPVACAGVSGSSNQYACRTGFDKTQQAGQNGAGIAIGIIEPGIDPTSQGLAGKPIEIYSGGVANNATYNYHGSGVANIILGHADIVPDSTGVANNNTGGLLPAISKLISSPGISSGIINNFASNDVRVVNWSGGIDIAYGETGDVAQANTFLPYWRYSQSQGLLLVMAAGNEGKANPSVTASLPAYDPSVLNATITVVAADPNTLGTTPALASYSNRCGVAADYCLTAPGTVWIPSETTPGAGRSFSGTSIATPIVSSAAALTWNWFPFMSQYQLRETLFTTATDLGAAGVDNIFGHGLVNVDKALDGPGAFRQNWDVTVGSDSYTFSNNISGTGGLNKSGAGTLILSGNNTFTGDINVNGGILGLDDSTNTASAFVNNGSLHGSGSVGSLYNNSYTSVGGGNLIVNGSYTQTAAGTLTVDINQTLDVTGSANVAGAFRSNIPDTYVVSGAIAPAISADGGLTGTFSSTTSTSALFSLVASYTATDLNIAITRLTAMSVLTPTSASKSDAQRIDDLFNAIDAAIANGSTPEAMQAAAAIQKAESAEVLAQVAKSISGSAYPAFTSNALAEDSAARRRAITKFVNANPGSDSFNVIGSSGQSSDFGQSGYGFGAGTVSAENNGWTFGAFGETTKNSMNGSDSNLRSKTDRFDLVAGNTINDTTTVVASVSYMSSDADVEREIKLPSYESTAFGDQSVSASTARVGVVKDVAKGFSLSSGVSAQSVLYGSLNEQGTSGLELNSQSRRATSVMADVGAYYNKSFTTQSGWTNSFTTGLDVEALVAGKNTNINSAYTGADFEFGLNHDQSDVTASAIFQWTAVKDTTGFTFDVQSQQGEYDNTSANMSFFKSF